MKLLFACALLIYFGSIAQQPPLQPKAGAKQVRFPCPEESLRDDCLEQCESCFNCGVKIFGGTILCCLANSVLHRRAGVDDAILCIDFRKMQLTHAEAGLALGGFVGYMALEYINGDLRERNKRRERLRRERHEQRITEVFHNLLTKKNN